MSQSPIYLDINNNKSVITALKAGEEKVGRKKKRYVEDHIFRIYPDYPLLVLDKIAWAKAGANDPLHFHYYLEIGYCYEGQGTIISEGEEAAFCQGSISLVAPNLLHATRKH